MNKKILITGATGFIGKMLLTDLYNQNFDITITSRRIKELEVLKNRFPRVTIISGDLENKIFVSSIVNNIDIIYHLAGYKYVSLSESNIMESVMSNIYTTNNLLNSISLLNRHVNIKIISTNKTINIRGIYAATKFISERLSMDFEKKYKNIKVDIVYLANIFSSPGSIGEVWKNRIISNDEIKITDLNCTRFFLTHEQALKILQNKKLNLDSIKAVKLADLLNTLILKYNKNFNKKLINKIGLGKNEDLHEFFPLKKHPSNLTQNYTIKELYEIL